MRRTSSLNKTSVLVTGETEALVVDAGFTRADGHRIVAAVLDSGKRLTTVVISAGDPGLLLRRRGHRRRVPRGRFLAPADVDRAHRAQLRGQAQGLGAPRRQPADPAGRPDPADRTDADRRRHHDRGTPRQRPARRPIVVPVRAGVALAVRRRAAVRGTPRLDRRQRDPGAAGRVDPRAGRPGGARPARTSSPGHRIAGAPTDLTAITHTREYLAHFEKTVAASADAAEAEARSWRPTRTPA